MSVPSPPGERLTRAHLAARLGVSASTIYRWQADPDTYPGFPTPDPDGSWAAQPAIDWHTRFVAAKKARLTPVDRDGDPDELIAAAEVARVLGYGGTRPELTIHSYRSARHGTYFPDPDATLTTSAGRQVPAWRRATIWAFADRRERHGGGTPGRSGRRARPDPALPRVLDLLAADPTITGPAVAAATGLTLSKAYRLLKAAKNPSPPAGPPTDIT